MLASDFGDAPAPYPTLIAAGGAQHEADGPILGVNRDADADGAPSVDALGDDSAGAPDDEDGVTFPATMRVGETSVEITIVVSNAPQGAKLDAWIDWNGDGSWGGPLDRIAHNLTLVEGTNTIKVDIPTWARPGTTYARFRLSSSGQLGFGGTASDGEVEDYAIQILPPVHATGVFGDQNIISTEADGPYSVYAADIDGDGDLDVLSASVHDNKVAWYENNGSGVFTPHIISTAARWTTSVFATDLDGDGDVDVLASANDDDTILWFENDGNQNFIPHVITTFADGASSVFAGDIDGDGDLDILSSSFYDDEVTWYENVGSGLFMEHTIATDADGALSVTAADIDGDGDLDVASASFNDGKVAWYENNGTGSFTEHVVTTAALGASSILAADMDGDGRADLVVASNSTNRVNWYKMGQNGTFTINTVSATTYGAFAIAAGDIDGDGDLDILSASAAQSTGSEIAWHENDGTGHFTSHSVTTNISGAASVFAADLDGDGTLDILSASNVDDKLAWYSNPDSASNLFVTLSTTAASVTKVAPIPVTATFTADVTGFEAGDINVVGGTVANFTGSGSVYTFDVIPTGQGLVTVSVPAHVALNSEENGNSQSNLLSRTYDSQSPTIVISSATGSSTRTAPIPVTVTFSEAVTGFLSSDLVVTGASISNFTGSGSVYTFSLTPTAQGTVTVNIAAGAASDAAGNLSLVANQFTRIFDSMPPTVSITSAAPNPTNVNPIPVTVTFSESVTGFAADDLVIAGGTIANFAGSGASYTFDIVPSGQGTVTVNLAGNRATDAAGNGNIAATQFQRTFDGQGPTVTLSSSTSALTSTSPIPVTVTFSESVTGFVSSDLVIAGGTISDFAGTGAVYTFNVTPTGSGVITVDLPAGVATDATGNANDVALQLVREFDNTAPVVDVGGGEVTFTKKQSPVAVVPDITTTEAHPGGGTLVISLSQPNTGKKHFDVLQTSSLNGLGTVNTTTVNGRLVLTISLDAGVTASDIQTALRGLKFSTSKKGLKIATRDLKIRLTDALGQTSSEVTQTIQVRKK